MSDEKPTYKNLLNQIDQPQPFLVDGNSTIKIPQAESVVLTFSTKIKPKELPILFKTPMIQAILNNTKFETRRDQKLKEINLSPDDWELLTFKVFSEEYGFNKAVFHNCQTEDVKVVKCPWMKNDILWCKETWRPNLRGTMTNPGYEYLIRYKAGGDDVLVPIDEKDWFEELTADGKYKWKSSMFMRRKFARIFLKVESVELQRLHDITEEQAISEGIEPWGSIQGAYFRNYSKNATTDIKHPNHESPAISDPIKSYKSLWESINGDGSWESNPWVWVIKFTKIENYGS